MTYTSPIQAIERILDKRCARGATDKNLISWLTRLKKTTWKNSPNMIIAINGFIDAIEQTPLNLDQSQLNLKSGFDGKNYWPFIIHSQTKKTALIQMTSYDGRLRGKPKRCKIHHYAGEPTVKFDYSCTVYLTEPFNQKQAEENFMSNMGMMSNT